MSLLFFSLLVQYEVAIDYKRMCLKRSELACGRRQKQRSTFDDIGKQTYCSSTSFIFIVDVAVSIDMTVGMISSCLCISST